MCRSRWIVLLVMAVLCVLLLGSCSKKDQESVPSVKQQLDKAQAAADAASQAAARTDQASAAADGSEEDQDEGEDDE